jgi:exodeoxyribonuclease VII large subunit
MIQASARLRGRLERSAARLDPALQADVRAHRMRFNGLAGRVSVAPLAATAVRHRRRLGEVETRLRQAGVRSLVQAQERLEKLDALLEALSYVNVLKRGFAVVYGAGDKPVRSSQGIRPGTPLDVEFADGRVKVAAEGAPRPRGRPSKPPPAGQGSLFD